MIRKPKTPISELQGEERKVLLAIVRIFVSRMSEMKQQLGIDLSEESMIKLIDKGIVRICTNDQQFWLEVYDPILDQYVRPGGGIDGSEEMFNPDKHY